MSPFFCITRPFSSPMTVLDVNHTGRWSPWLARQSNDRALGESCLLCNELALSEIELKELMTVLLKTLILFEVCSNLIFSVKMIIQSVIV